MSQNDIANAQGGQTRDGDAVIRVLLVDDQAMIGEAIRRMFAPEADIEYRYCTDATMAMQVIKEFKPTVILQDLVMPGVDGMDLLSQYRKDVVAKHIPVVMLSSKDDVETKSLAFLNGASDYLIKLPDVIELVARIRRHSATYSNQIERDEARRAMLKVMMEAENNNRAKSDFVTNLSHELRKPMNLVLGFGQVLESDATLTPAQKDNVDAILKAGQHLLDIITELPNLAQLESGQIDISLEPLELDDLIEECLSLVVTMADKRGVALSYTKAEGAMVWADPRQLKQALLNLLSNAIKYNREDGNVKVEVRAEGANRLQIRIADTGHGIAAENLPNLFQPFNRLDSENDDIEGGGLGLTITRSIMDMMGGTVGVESKLGVGSTFWVGLPLESAPEAGAEHGKRFSPGHIVEPAPINAELNATKYADGQCTVLYIEDNPTNVKLVTRILAQRKNINLISALTPELGIEMAHEHKPALILLDINMPHLNGYQVFEIFKADAELKKTPVIAVSANALLSDVEKGIAAGFADYITKPIWIETFLRTIDRNLQA